MIFLNHFYYLNQLTTIHFPTLAPLYLLKWLKEILVLLLVLDENIDVEI